MADWDFLEEALLEDFQGLLSCAISTYAFDNADQEFVVRRNRNFSLRLQCVVAELCIARDLEGAFNLLLRLRCQARNEPTFDAALNDIELCECLKTLFAPLSIRCNQTLSDDSDRIHDLSQRFTHQLRDRVLALETLLELPWQVLTKGCEITDDASSILDSFSYLIKPRDIYLEAAEHQTELQDASEDAVFVGEDGFKELEQILYFLF